MPKVTLQFKAKVNPHGFFKFPMLGRRHVVEGLQGNGRVMSYSNSSMFEGVLNDHLKKELRLPAGLSCILADVLPLNPCLTVEPGYLHMFTITFEDSRR